MEEINVKDSWEHRSARMHPQHSQMEISLLITFHLNGYHPYRDISFTLPDGRVTTPDFYFHKEMIPVYIDHSLVHFKKQDRDKAIREMLLQNKGVKRVVSVGYTRYSEKEVTRIYEEVKRKVKCNGNERI